MAERAIHVLGRYVASTSNMALPPEVVNRAKEIVLDTVGSMLVGTQLGPGRAVIQYARSRGEVPVAPVFGAALRTGLTTAVLANATLAHADEVDDSHFSTLTHPAAAAVPAALSLAQTTKSSGAEALRAIVAGYDVQCRLSLAMDPRSLQSRGFMPLAVCAHFGAATVAASLLRMSDERVRDTLGIVGCQAAGLWACATDGTHLTTALMAGGPARTGVEAALLVEQGFRGPPDIFEGPDGVLAAFSDTADSSKLADGLGTRFEIMRTSIKKHACGGPIRGPVDGLLQLMDDNGLSARSIKRIDVRLARAACAIVGNREDLAICLEHVMAVAAIDRFVGIQQTHSPSRTQAADVLDLRDRVTLIPDDELEKVWPSQRPAVVTIETTDGRTMSIRVDEAKGSPDNPLTRSEVVKKYTYLTDGIIDSERRDELAELILNLERQTSLDRTLSLLGEIEG